MMLERQREGIAKAKAEGVYRGRKPTARAKVDEVRGVEAGRQEHARDRPWRSGSRSDRFTAC